MTDTATRELTWPARTGNLPVSGLPPEQALSFFQWAGQNAGQMLNVEHDRGNVTDDVFAASGDDPLTWWQSTALFDALRTQAGLAPEPAVDLTAELARTRTELAKRMSDSESQAALINRLTGELNAAREASARTEDQTAIIDRLTAELRAAREASDGDVDSAAELHAAHQHANEQAVRAEQAEQALLHERERVAALEAAHADNTASPEIAAELAAARRQVDELATSIHNERVRVQELESALAAAQSDATAIVPYDDSILDETRHELSDVTQELDQANLHNERLTEQIAMFEADQTRHQSVRGLTRTVNIGTGVVMVAVAALVCAGSAATAHEIAGWPWWSAVIVPIVVEGGAVVELAALVRNRRLGIPSHWTAKVLATGLLGLSLIGLGLHARSLSTHWWSMILGISLPLIMVGTARAALGNSHTRQTDSRQHADS